MLRPTAELGEGALVPWLVAFVTQFLQGALGRVLIPDGAEGDAEELTIQLVSARVPSEGLDAMPSH